MIPYVRIPAIDLGILTLHPFGILVALGVLVGIHLTMRRARKLGYDVVALSSFLTWMLVGGFVSGHVLDSVMYHGEELARRPWSIFLLWEGLSSFGGFVGAVAGIVLWKYVEWRPPKLARRRPPRAILPFADLVLSVFPIGWAFGRAGCSVVHDHPGARATAAQWLAVAYPEVGGADHAAVTKLGFVELVHGSVPTYDLGLLELAFTVVLAICFAATWSRRMPSGTYVVVATLAYAPVRFALDFLRAPEPLGDPRYDLLGLALTPAQWLCMLLFAFGIAMCVQLVRRSGRNSQSALAPESG